MSTAEIAAYEAGYRAGQEDMRQRAANVPYPDVHNIGFCIRIDILALPILDRPQPKHAAPDVFKGEGKTDG